MLLSLEDEVIEDLQKKFFVCSDLKLINIELLVGKIKSTSDPLATQLQVLRETIFHELNVSYPLNPEFQKRFLKNLIQLLEECEEEVSDELYDAYVKNLNTSDQDHHYRHFKINSSYITVRGSTKFVSEGTTGLFTWEGGLALAEWCLANRSQLSGQRVLELGCGVGLTGLAVSATCSPQSYTFTDCHPAVLDVLDHNIQLNRRLFGNASVTSQLLDWENFDGGRQVDIVLAADVVYESMLFPSLVNTLRHLLDQGAYAVFACTERNPDTLAGFLKCVAEKDVSFEELDCPPPDIFHYSCNPPIRIFKFTLSGASVSVRNTSQLTNHQPALTSQTS